MGLLPYSRGGTNRLIPAQISDNSTDRPSSDTRALYKGHVRYVNYDNLVSITAYPNLTRQQTTVQKRDFGFLNAQSVNTKASKIREHITDHNLDIIGITETWKLTNTKIAEVKPDGFSFLYKRWRRSAGHFVLVGDFNYHLNNTNDYKACQFIHLLDTFNLVQHISEPTHMSGHTLALIITRSCESTVSDIIVYPYGIIADHSAISMNLQIIKPRLSKKVVTYRKTRSIDIQSFRKDVFLCGVV